MWRRSVVLLTCIACMIALMIAPMATRAEDTGCVEGLVAADCDLLDAAAVNVDKLTTFDLGYELNFALTGAPVGDISLNVKGHGPVDLTEITNSDTRTVFDNLKMSSALEMTAVAQGNQTVSKLEVRAADGSIYFFSDQATGGSSGWYKIVVSKLVASASNNPDLASLNIVLLPQLLMGQATAYGNTTGTRKPGPSLDGRATRLYSLHYEGGVLLDTLPKPQQQLLLTQLITGLLQNLPQAQRTKLQGNAAFKRAVERVVRGAQIAIGWLVDPSGKMIRGFGIEIHIKVDAAVGKLIAPQFAAGLTNFDITLLVTYSKLGSKVKVDVPPNAIDLTDMIQVPGKSA